MAACVLSVFRAGGRRSFVAAAGPLKGAWTTQHARAFSSFEPITPRPPGFRKSDSLPHVYRSKLCKLKPPNLARVPRSPGKRTLSPWHLFDAKDQKVGAMASFIAKLLMGKYKPTYRPSSDDGDFVVRFTISLCPSEDDWRIFFEKPGS